MVTARNVGTQMERDELNLDWGDIVDKKEDDSLSETLGGVEPGHSQNRPVGKSGLVYLLNSLDICQTGLGQYGDKVNDEIRNGRTKGVIDCGDDGNFWVILDDICILISKSDKGYEAEEYVKRYGDFVDLMCSENCSKEFSIVEVDSDCYKECDDAAWKEMPRTLQLIRSRHPPRKYRSGYGQLDSGYDPGGGQGLYGYGRHDSGYGYSGTYGLGGYQRCHGGFGGDPPRSPPRPPFRSSPRGHPRRQLKFNN
jgi:hypothetical protein